MSHELLAVVERAIATQGLLTPGSRVVIGVSGGADSVALLHLLTRLQSRWKLTLHVAHFDHALRQDSNQDAAFVQDVGARWKLASTVERCDVDALCQRRGWSLEEGARHLRYQFFLTVARRVSASHVALAHTADDQAETVLMRLVRGTGLMGLGAMSGKRWLDEAQGNGSGVWLVRPLLQVWRQQVLAYLEDAGVVYREDASNQDRRFTRNRIRHDLLPLLERDYNPQIKEALAQLADLSQGDYGYLQEAVGKQWKRMVKSSPHSNRLEAGQLPSRVSITVRLFLRQPTAVQRQVVRRAVERVRGDLNRFEFRHWLEAQRLFLERPVGTVLDLPGGVQLRREREQVVCMNRDMSPPGTATEETGERPVCYTTTLNQ